MSSKQLLFIHIPKTGGTTVNGFMGECLGQCLDFIDGQDYRSKAFFKTHRYYAGHVRLAQVRPFIRRRDFYVFTFIREPVAQVLSHLSWAKSKTRGGKKPDPQEWDAEYLRLFADVKGLDLTSADDLHGFTREKHSYRRLFDNQQTRFLLEARRSGALDFGDFRAALEALQAFDFVGTTDRLEEGLRHVAKTNGLKAPKSVAPLNTRAWRADYGLERIDPAIKGALVDYTKWDELIYAAAKECLDT